MASDHWQGSLQGCYFGKGDRGQGYYELPVATSPDDAAAQPVSLLACVVHHIHA